MKDLTIVGYGHSDMDDLAIKYASKEGRYITPDPDPGKGYFSDLTIFILPKLEYLRFILPIHSSIGRRA